MYFLCLVLNLLAMGALFSNHRLAAVASFFGYTALNLALLFQKQPTGLDPAFFVIQALAMVAVYAILGAHARDHVLTHQKKRAGAMLLLWALVIAVFFGHWFLGLYLGAPVVDTGVGGHGTLPQGETFMLIAVVIMWMVGKNLYDRR